LGWVVVAVRKSGARCLDWSELGRAPVTEGAVGYCFKDLRKLLGKQTKETKKKKGKEIKHRGDNHGCKMPYQVPYKSQLKRRVGTDQGGDD